MIYEWLRSNNTWLSNPAIVQTMRACRLKTWIFFDDANNDQDTNDDDDNGDNDRDNGDSKFYFFLSSNSGQTLLMASVIMTMMRETYFLFLQTQGRLC